ncbi:hypothetical protein [Tsukamurella paurometabola]|uniref:DUF304 domain-containing protein n=1 Tax=Tsukamurella paurometabola TaxID=2061 RepID=A0ABS5NJ17_TSUPA|nr:hypothetical protein [Tsukamurella paurometabola]MBS4104300.1 hypothetical protein [Tsukamurella paurometabola]
MLALGGFVMVGESVRDGSDVLAGAAFGIACGIAGVAVWFAAPATATRIPRPAAAPTPPASALVVRGRIGVPFLVAATGLVVLDGGVAFVVITSLVIPLEVGPAGILVMMVGFAAVITSFFSPIPISMWRAARLPLWWISESAVGIGGVPAPVPIERVRSIVHRPVEEQGVVLEHLWTVVLDSGASFVVSCPAGSSPRPRRIRRTVHQALGKRAGDSR